MRHKALGPVWHATPTAQGLLPDRRRGVDPEATWGKRHEAGGVDGHGAGCVVSHRPGVLGAFQARRHRAHEAHRLWLETGPLRGISETVMRDGKAEAQELCAEFQRHRGMPLWTTPRNNSDHPAARPQMLNILPRPKSRRRRQPRGQTVEPRQGVVKDISALERCWRRGHRNNRWLLAARGVTGQLHQARALKSQRAGWRMTQEVVGL